MEPRVADVLVSHPKTLPADVTVAEARAAFGDHVHMLLLVDPDQRLSGTLRREDLPEQAAGSGPASAHAVLEGRTVDADLPAEQARQFLLASGQRRLAVLDDEGRVRGLLCLKRRLTGFCSDANVASRAAERGERPCAPGSQSEQSG